jgi:hypothetical protein
MNCELCSRYVFERNIQEQCGFYICRFCNGKYSDEELKKEMKKDKNNGID